MTPTANEEGLYDCSDGEPCICYSNRKIPARKTWTCEECKHPIVAGEVYHRIIYLWEGEWCTHTICVCCENARCAIAAAAGSGMCIMFGSLWEVAEYLIEDGALTRQELEEAKVG